MLGVRALFRTCFRWSVITFVMGEGVPCSLIGSSDFGGLHIQRQSQLGHGGLRMCGGGMGCEGSSGLGVVFS